MTTVWTSSQLNVGSCVSEWAVHCWSMYVCTYIFDAVYTSACYHSCRLHRTSRQPGCGFAWATYMHYWSNSLPTDLSKMSVTLPWNQAQSHSMIVVMIVLHVFLFPCLCCQLVWVHFTNIRERRSMVWICPKINKCPYYAHSKTVCRSVLCPVHWQRCNSMYCM